MADLETRARELTTLRNRVADLEALERQVAILQKLVRQVAGLPRPDVRAALHEESAPTVLSVSAR